MQYEHNEHNTVEENNKPNNENASTPATPPRGVTPTAYAVTRLAGEEDSKVSDIINSNGSERGERRIEGTIASASWQPPVVTMRDQLDQDEPTRGATVVTTDSPTQLQTAGAAPHIPAAVPSTQAFAQPNTADPRHLLTPSRRSDPAADAVLRDLFKRKAKEVLERKIEGTTLLGEVRVRCRCELCHTEEVRSSPQYWKSLMGLTGECFKCEGYVSVETAFLNRERQEIVVVSPDSTEQQLLDSLCRVAEYVPPRQVASQRPSAATATSGAVLRRLQAAVVSAVAGPAPISTNNASPVTPTDSTRRPAATMPMTLSRAIMSGVANDVRPFITPDNINDVVDRGMTALFLACYNGKEDIVDLLLELGADVHAKSKDSMRAIHGAACKSVKCVQKLLDACVKGLSEESEKQAARRQMVNYIDAHGFTPLHNSCMEGQLDISKLLVKNGTDVTATTDTKATPLHLAARFGLQEAIKLLLAARAPVDALDVFGRTPLANTIYFGKELAGKALIEGGASLIKIKSDLPIPMWAGGEAGKVIEQKDIQIADLQDQIKRLNELRGSPAAVEVQNDQALREMREARIQAETHARAADKRLRDIQVQMNLQEDRAAKMRQTLQKTEQDNERLKTELGQAQANTVSREQENVSLKEQNTSLSSQLDAIKRAYKELSYAWDVLDQQWGDRSEARQREATWNVALQEFQEAEERLGNTDEAELNNQPLFVATLNLRNEKRAVVRELAPVIIKDHSNALERVKTLQQCVMQYGDAPVEEAEIVYRQRRREQALSQTNTALALQQLKAALKRQELLQEQIEHSRLLEQVESKLKQQQTLSESEKQAHELVSQLYSQRKLVQRARKELQHAQEMVDEPDSSQEDLDKLSQCRDAYKEKRGRYSELEALAREFEAKGFVEFRSFIGLSKDDFRVESQEGAIWKGWRGNNPFALKCRPTAQVEREFAALRKLNHPFVISAEAMFVESASMSVLVMPWIKYTLDQWLASENPSVLDRREAFRCILQGLAHVHSSSIVHGDIRPQNILVESDGQARICDFSSSLNPSFVSAETVVDKNKALEVYDAPELELPEARKTTASDIFAFGVCVWKAFFTRDPYLSLSDQRPTVPKNDINGLTRVLEWTLARSKRPTVHELFAFEFFKDSQSKQQSDSSSRINAFRASIKMVRDSTEEYEEQYDPRDAVTLTFIKANFIDDVADALLATQSMLTAKFDVKFDGEEGIDAGALTVEMYKRFFKAVCASKELFESGPQGKLLPRNVPALSERELKIFRAVGVALARILLTEGAVKVPFASAMFKFFQEVKVTIEDLEEFDSQDRWNMSILRSATGDCSLYNFEDVAECERAVNPYNKGEYVNKFIQWKLIGSRTSALLAIREGLFSFGEEINRHLRILKPEDMRVLLCGAENLTPSDLLDRLQFEGFGQSSTPAFLRDVIQRMSEEELRRFLCFVTSQDSLPVATEVKPIKVVRVAGDDRHLPVAHACFWQLDIPDYSSVDALRDQLGLATTEENLNEGFTMK